LTEQTPGRARPGRSAILALAALVAGAATFLFSELAIIALVAALGPVVAFVVLTAACAAVSVLIAVAFDAEDGGRGLPRPVARARAWIQRNLEAAEKRSRRFAHLSEGAAFAALSVTAGPFLTTVVVKLRGGSRRTGYALCVASSALFSAVWVAVYAGGLAVLREAFG
jgi:hypothetical protein